jgi:hypothetical protein
MAILFLCISQSVVFHQKQHFFDVFEKGYDNKLSVPPFSDSACFSDAGTNFVMDGNFIFCSFLNLHTVSEAANISKANFDCDFLAPFHLVLSG